ncbi:MAG TPA: hypothetical protein VLF14_02345, partial [Candidatus Binatia bacterium]|nr:hypothetical protein [Candidatus Binatia bacterium]
ARFGITIMLAVASCESPLADYSGYVAPRPYAIDCDSAWQNAATALKTNGFVIAEVRRETPGEGVVVGKRGSETMTIGVSCEADGVHVTPSGLTPFARNGMRIAFERVTETARVVRAPMGMEVSAELITGPESALYFRTGLGASSAARFRIANGGSRAMRLVTRNIRLRTSSGASVAAIEPDDLERRAPGLATEIASRLLTSAVLETGARAEGFLIFPEDRYDAALIPLIDVETNEPEEFEVSFLHDVSP